MRRATDACVAPTDNIDRSSSADNKELLRQQLLTGNKEPEKPKHSRSRQKNRWKLKFHHQALPQEYLDHYEQSLQKVNAAKKIKQEKIKTEIENDNQIYTDIANETPKTPHSTRVQSDACSSNMTHKHRAEEKKRRHAPAIAPSKIVTYDDLPYMGEMTLNNSKPRRGRKPKKADICHLIYENYGTVVPGQPPSADDKPLYPACRPTKAEHVAPFNTSKTDLQNKIISSLLERKLSQENRRRFDAVSPRRAPNEPLPAAPPTAPGRLHSDSEPLNLCIRDLHELKIQIQKRFGNIYSSLPDVKDEVVDADEEDHQSEQSNAISVIQRNTSLTTTGQSTASSSPDFSRQRVNISPTLSEPAHSSLSTDGAYWPDTGIYMHPLALQTQLLYYQRLAAAGRLQITNDEQERPPSTATSVSGSDSICTEVTTPPADDTKTKLVLKQISELLDPKVIKRVEEAKRSPERTKRASPNPPTRQGPAKRKRSAIFIPPIPPKSNSTTPTAEVSICKFKFTGGSKPSLQEKKMLSVDSGGNFRYYSGGGGGKGNKGHDHVHHLSASDAGTSGADRGPSELSVKEDSKKKRKSRKSLQREKLEQTFKEKGFLIQTQQLQSAEGATYCKFRQLRKFTRYLFRSWKDYLPGELEERPTQTPVVGEWG